MHSGFNFASYGYPSMVNSVMVQRRWTVDGVAACLLPLSSIYLAVPHLIFFFGWLHWPWAVLAAVIVATGLFAVARVSMRLLANQTPLTTPPVTWDESQESKITPTTSQQKKEFVFHREHALIILALCLIWLTLSGVGGFVAQDLDWNKHNTVLNSLIAKPWPTVYEIYKVDVPLVYYIAYYLPAALVGKLAGWFWANVALYAWSLVGLILSVLWFCVLVGRAGYSTLLIFIFFSGLDVIGKALASYGEFWAIASKPWDHIDSWAGLWQYSSNATLLNWVPHQGIAGWIVAGMTLYTMLRLRRRELALLPFGLSALWTPFVTVGMLPYLVVNFLVDDQSWARRLRRFVSLPNVAGMVALAITGFYFSAKASEGSPIVIQSMLGGLSIENYAGSALDAIAFLLFFCLLEFGVYAILLYRSGAVSDERWRWIFDMTVMTLLILPWFKLGIYNDLVMRASIPAMFVLSVFVARAVHDGNLARQTRVALIVVLLVGAVTAGIEFKRHFERMVSLPAPIEDLATRRWDFVYYMQRQTFFFGQYSGAVDSPFFRFAAKPVPEVEAAPGSAEAQLNAHDFVLYGDLIYLLRDEVTAPPEIVAGETMTVTAPLHFFGPAIRQRYDPVVRLVDGEGKVVASAHAWANEYPEISAFWMTHWTGTVTMTVPVMVAPGGYTVELGLLGEEDGEMLLAESVPAGETIGESAPISTTVTVR